MEVKKRKVHARNPLHMVEIHKYYRKNYKDIVNREDYAKIIQAINRKVFDEVIDGLSFDVPYLHMKLYFHLTKGRVGKLNFAGDKIANYIDCIGSHKMHKEYPELKEQGVYLTSYITKVFKFRRRYSNNTPPALKFFNILRGTDIRDKSFKRTLEYN